MWTYHHIDQQLRHGGMGKNNYSLGVYLEECNQAKTSLHVVVQRLQSRLGQSALGTGGMVERYNVSICGFSRRADISLLLCG